MTAVSSKRQTEKGWNPDAQLHCMRCGELTPIGPAYVGCAACSKDTSVDAASAPLEVEYTGTPPDSTEIHAVTDWLTEHHQPITRDARVRLGRPVTPLVQAASFGPNVYVKNETVNPTWGHKDRLHEVAVGAARLLGARGIVATSTGNHGAAAAAHAAAGGLPSLVFCHREASSTAMLMIAAYGGVVAQLPAHHEREAVIRLVDDGWFPATSMDPDVAGRANPYGAEGYKEVAYEVVRGLDRTPDVVVVPTASGDTIYGIAKGFAEVSRLTGLPMPLIAAGQPATADALVRSHRAGHRVEVPDASSLALSVADPVSGRQAMIALQRWNGEAVSVTEANICEATADFARIGLLVEPASAVSLAAYRALLDQQKISRGDTAVLIATSSGAKWPRELSQLFPAEPIRDAELLHQALSTAGSQH